MPVTDAKTTNTRLHLDLSPDPGEQEAESDRMISSRRSSPPPATIHLHW
jgi:hypothetical protein